MAKKSINRQVTSNYHDPTECHFPPLPQYSPHIISSSTFVSICLFCICESLFCSPARLSVTLTFLLSVDPEVN
nr:hypothetical transcript [Hymenolepis microstoma]